MSERVKVIIWVSGGVVQSVTAGPFVEYVIHDEDEVSEDGGLGLEVARADRWSAVCDEVWSQATAGE